MCVCELLLDWPEDQLQHDIFTEEPNQSPEQSQRHRAQLKDMQKVKGHLLHDRAWSSCIRWLCGYLERCVDPADQCVQDVNVVMCVQQDEGEEGLEEGGLRDGAQEQVQVCCGSHHFLHRQLLTDRQMITYTRMWLSNRYSMQVFLSCWNYSKNAVLIAFLWDVYWWLNVKDEEINVLSGHFNNFSGYKNSWNYCMVKLTLYRV